MQLRNLKFKLLLAIFTFSFCTKDTSVPIGSIPSTPTTTPQTTEWLIPQESVFDGGPGKDGIPSIDEPKFSKIAAINFLNPEDLILGVKVGSEIRGYPHPILDWHEIVNDKIGEKNLAITYCPLTGTGIAWDRNIEGTITTFGVSGLLYNSNLIPYDRASDSNWSQMLLMSVQGSQQSKIITTYPLIESSWQTWQQLFPESEVLNTTTGFNRSYGNYPYGGYKTNNNQLLFPVENNDSRLAQKERGLGIIAGGQTKFYRLESFSQEFRVINDFVGGIDVVLFGSKEKNFIVAYQRAIDDRTTLRFSPSPAVSSSITFIDDQGNEWNIFGEAIDGPLKGTHLKPTVSYMGYWFAWAAFYPEIQVL